jgi:uncharacterized protein YyaL (SSP411 family)
MAIKRFSYTIRKTIFMVELIFPPVRSFNRSSWQETLLGIIKAFNENRSEVDTQAENLTAHLLQSSSLGIRNTDTTQELFAEEKLKEVFENLMNNSDRVWGGFGRAPKFPQTFSIQYLLRYCYFFQMTLRLPRHC